MLWTKCARFFILMIQAIQYSNIFVWNINTVNSLCETFHSQAIALQCLVYCWCPHLYCWLMPPDLRPKRCRVCEYWHWILWSWWQMQKISFDDFGWENVTLQLAECFWDSLAGLAHLRTVDLEFDDLGNSGQSRGFLLHSASRLTQIR